MTERGKLSSRQWSQYPGNLRKKPGTWKWNKASFDVHSLSSRRCRPGKIHQPNGVHGVGSVTPPDGQRQWTHRHGYEEGGEGGLDMRAISMLAAAFLSYSGRSWYKARSLPMLSSGSVLYMNGECLKQPEFVEREFRIE